MRAMDVEAKLFFKTYKRLPLEVERGEGCYLFTTDGRKYLDMFSGLAVNALGYNHPGVNTAIETQIRKYNHLSNFFVQQPQIELAERLIRIWGFKRFFSRIQVLRPSRGRSNSRVNGECLSGRQNFSG